MVGPPPSDRRPPPGHEHFLPEYAYFDEGPQAFDAAVLSTISCAARWADRYEAYDGAGRGPTREGRLPSDDTARGEAVADLVAWVTQHFGDELHLAAVSLFRGQSLILAQPDETPGPLTLTPAEFSEMQDCWEARGLPRDLYYPARQQREAVALTEMFHGVVKVRRWYTPRQWEQRDSERALRLPTESERRARFYAACNYFLMEMSLRVGIS